MQGNGKKIILSGFGIEMYQSIGSGRWPSHIFCNNNCCSFLRTKKCWDNLLDGHLGVSIVRSSMWWSLKKFHVFICSSATELNKEGNSQILKLLPFRSLSHRLKTLALNKKSFQFFLCWTKKSLDFKVEKV